MPDPRYATPPGIPGNAEPNAANSQIVRFPASTLYSRLQAQRLPTDTRSFRTSGSTDIYNPTVSRNKPVQFEVGSFECPKDQAILITNYKINIATFSGVAAGDVEILSPPALSTRMGFSLRVNQKNPPITGTLALDAVPPQADFEAIVNTVSFRGGSISTSFIRANANAYGLASGAGRFLIPYNGVPLGDPSGPFTLVVTQGQTAGMGIFVFQPLVQPVAYFEIVFQSTQVPTRLLQQLMDSINV